MHVFALGYGLGNINWGERERERERERYKSFKDGKSRGKLGRWSVEAPEGKSFEVVASHSSVTTIDMKR